MPTSEDQSRNLKYQPIYITSANVRTASTDIILEQIIRTMHLNNISFLFLQETRRKTETVELTIERTRYVVYFSGHDQDNKYHGVGFAVKDRSCKLLEVQPISNRILVAKLSIQNFKLRVINCYSPTDVNTEQKNSDRIEFYEKLQSILEKTSKNMQDLICGDFNCNLRLRNLAKFSGNKTIPIPDTANSNFLRNFLTNNNLCLPNTFFKHIFRHRYTHVMRVENGRKIRRIIDYFICSNNFRRLFVKDVRVYSSIDFSSDHRPLTIKLKIPTNRISSKALKKRKSQKQAATSKPDFDQLQNNKSTSTKFLNSIESSISQNNIRTHEQIMETLSSAVEKIPKIITGPKSNPWDDDPLLKRLHKNKFRAKKEGKKELASQIDKVLKSRLNIVRNSYYKNAAQQINTAAQLGNLREVWKLADNYTNFHIRPPEKIEKKMQPILKDFFQQHYSKTEELSIPTELENPPPSLFPDLTNISNKIKQGPPCRHEIAAAIKGLKSNKGAIDLPSEVFKTAIQNQNFLTILTEFYSNIWLTGVVPDDWGISRLSVLWKRKGSREDPSKYRGISVGSSLCKIACKIYLSRFSKFYDSSILESQMGFRPNRGCDDALYNFKSLQIISKLANRPLYTVCIDYSAAFDLLPRDFSFINIEKRLGRTDANLNVIKNLYAKTSFYMSWEDSTQAVQTTRGIRQGGIESPQIYTFLNDTVLRIYRHRCHLAGIEDFSVSYCIPSYATNSRKIPEGIISDSSVSYADDTTLSFSNAESANKATQILHDICTEFGFKLNLTKSETMISNFPVTSDYPDSFVKIKDPNGVYYELKNQKKIKLLGAFSQFDSSASLGSYETNYRIASALTAYKKKEKFFKNNNINLSWRKTIFNSIVRSRLTYGCRSWRLTTNEMSKINSFWNTSIRCLVRHGQSRKQNSYAYRLTNKQIYEKTDLDPIYNFILDQQTKFLQHIIRGEDTRISKQLLFHDEKKKLRGRFKSQFDTVVQNSEVDCSQFCRMSFEKGHKIKRIPDYCDVCKDEYC